MHGFPGAYAPRSAETGPSGLGGVCGRPNQVLSHLALLRSALQAWCGHRGPGAGFGAWCGPQGLVLLVGLAHVCDSGLKGRFPLAQGAALGGRGPKKVGF